MAWSNWFSGTRENIPDEVIAAMTQIAETNAQVKRIGDFIESMQKRDERLTGVNADTLSEGVERLAHDHRQRQLIIALERSNQELREQVEALRVELNEEREINARAERELDRQVRQIHEAYQIEAFGYREHIARLEERLGDISGPLSG